MYTFIKFGLNMALRPSELVHLDWSEIVEHSGRWFVSIKNLDVRLAKNPLAKTCLQIPPTLLELLDCHFERKELGPLWPSASKSGSHKHHLQKLKPLLSAPWFNLYSLRRTCLTNWYNLGMETGRITKLARHTNDVVTRAYYLKPSQYVGTDGLPILL